jgi:DNA-nicking Smr family endonuclease
MARRRRKQGRTEQEQAAQSATPTSAPAATTSLGSLLKAAQIDVKKAPAKPAKQPASPFAKPSFAPSAHSGAHSVAPRVPGAKPEDATDAPAASATELRMLNDAYEGARPIARKSARLITPRVKPGRMTESDRSEELAARKRLAELVSGGVHFKVRREDEYVTAYRIEGSRKLVDRLGGQGFAAEATLDLHGERTARVGELVSSFVRGHHRRGARHLLIIVGKGLHSEDGTGVLLPAVIDALTQGLCAPLVRGFATAHQRHGGTGAIAVLLV